ncbi:MAG: c-type cytochrome [Gammaproteobacteria bacterium]|nr:c-type cytochrome [Gammaproteobacteria bacterium]
MQKIIEKGVCFVVFLLFSTLCFAEYKTPPTLPYPTIDYSKLNNADIVKKGEYLAKAGDCIACHTNTDQEGAPVFAGGLGINTPFGVFYTPNISPDKKTGIGNWSDADFIKAMREGLNPHNENYFPVFPYLYFNKVSDEDLLAIKAYLFSIPAVEYTPPKNSVGWPFSVRFLQWGWKMMFFYPDSGPFKENPRYSKQWNRGAYLVKGLGHCSMCHTPLNPFGAPKTAYYLGGGVVDNFPAPNITSVGLKDFSAEQVKNVFLQDQMLGGGKIEGPMLDVNHNSLRYLSQEDLDAIVFYLKTVKSKPLPKPKVSSGAGLGKGIYETYCAACHASGAAGAPVVGDQAAWAPRIKIGMDALYHNAINGINAMPAKGTCTSCTDQEIQAAVQYMVKTSEAGSEAEVNVPVSMPAPTVNLENGKKIYTETCSTCHTKGQLGAPKLGDKAAWAPLIKQNMDVLFAHTLSGYNNMPVKGGCQTCQNSDIMDAVVYMVQQSKQGGDYLLW